MCQCDAPPSPPPAPVPTPPLPADSHTWAVLAAGSSTYWNYRHQADICHAYQILKRNGVSPERIITLIYDDVAHASENPFPGQLFNQPNGHDVYGGCQIDYRGDALSPSLFLSVLKGESEAVAGLGLGSNGNGKVLKSGPHDDVFVYFADHGGTGMIMFPGGAISASDLIGTLKQMHSTNMYRELVFYLDTCESGSMFTSLPEDIGVLAVSSSRPDENANAIWCYEPDTDIQGKNIGSCLGDAMSVGWMIDSDKNFQESLNAQFQTVYKWSMTSRCNPIPCFNMPCMYGDLSIAEEPLVNFQGQSSGAQATLADAHGKRSFASAIDARDVKLELLRSRALASNNASTWKLVRVEEAFRQRVDEFFAELAKDVCASGSCDAAALLKRVGSMKASYESCHPDSTFDLHCHKILIDAISADTCPSMSWGDYSAKYAKLLADFCSTGVTTEALSRHVRASCTSMTPVV
jgi:legumain